MVSRDAEEIKAFVRERYAGLAQQAGCGCASSCCGPVAAGTRSMEYAERLYSQGELQSVPQDAGQMALGCGNPTAIAQLEPGDVVLDLGSGGGIDCFLAAQKVGAEGRVIGLDMTPDMIGLARRNAAKMGVENVEFRLGEMEDMPVQAESVDVIISNCVVNLSPDKDQVFQESYRVLKPGGRLCVSDIVTLGELPPQVRESEDEWARCVAGALEKDVYLAKMTAAGFEHVQVEGLAVSCQCSSEGLMGRIASMTVVASKLSS